MKTVKIGETFLNIQYSDGWSNRAVLVFEATDSQPFSYVLDVMQNNDLSVIEEFEDGQLIKRYEGYSKIASYSNNCGHGSCTFQLDKLSKEEQMVAGLVKEMNVLKADIEAYQNSYESMFDGLKIVSSYDNPLKLVVPMMVKRNVFYLADDGHVYVANQDGIVTDENFEMIMDDMDAPAV